LMKLDLSAGVEVDIKIWYEQKNWFNWN
jgi:hypothetical protein